MRGHRGGVDDIAFSPDGAHIVSAAHDYSLLVWDAETGRPIGEPMRIPMGGTSGVGFSSDGARIFALDLNHNAHWRDATTGEAIGEPTPPTREPWIDCFWPPRLCADPASRLWHVASGRVVELRRHTNGIQRSR